MAYLTSRAQSQQTQRFPTQEDVIRNVSEESRSRIGNVGSCRCVTLRPILLVCRIMSHTQDPQ